MNLGSRVTEGLPTDPRFRVLIHGGAWAIPEALRQAHADGVRAAYEATLEALRMGLHPLEAVVLALGLLEDDPTFDAGTGSFLDAEGRVSLDAAVMEGRELRAGAVACLGSFPHPSEIALAILRHTEHVLLVGAGAETFAQAMGFQAVPPENLIHPREREAHARWIAAGRPDPKVFFADPTESAAGPDPHRRGTVGVVVGVRGPEGRFHLFAGTSTGGVPGKRPGRVGDVPLVGCGLYADDEGAAVSCTGWGEGLIRIAAAKAVNERVKAGQSPQEAAEGVLAELWRRTRGRGGLIVIDAQGRTGAAFSTPDMAFAGPDVRALVWD